MMSLHYGVAASLRQGAEAPELSGANADYLYVSNIDTAEVYYSRNSATQLVPASLTKLMTALVIATEKEGALTDTITIESGDFTGLATFSKMGLQAGDVISYNDVLHGILNISGGDGCQAAAREIGDLLTPSGGVSRFVDEMNTVAVALGMSGTVFSNTFGNDDSGANYSTAIDLCKLLGACANNAVISSVIRKSEYSATVTGANARVFFISNTNPILEDEGVLGGKTGTYLGLPSDPSIYNLANIWQAPNGERVGIVTAHSDTTADRQADHRLAISSLLVDYPDLAISIAPDNGAGFVLLENNTDKILLKNETDFLLLEG